MTLPGTEMTATDLAKLAACGIDAAVAKAAMLWRVRSAANAARDAFQSAALRAVEAYLPDCSGGRR